MSAAYHKVMIVDDEANLRSIIARNLSARGHQVVEADSVVEALKRLAEDRPDLLLLDINLPDRTGWDLLRQLKRDGSQVPVVIVSAVRVSPERLAEFKPLAYLPKPFPLPALLRIVDGEQVTDQASGLDDPPLRSDRREWIRRQRGSGPREDDDERW